MRFSESLVFVGDPFCCVSQATIEPTTLLSASILTQILWISKRYVSFVSHSHAEMNFFTLEQSWKMKDLETTLMSCSLQVRNHRKFPFMLILYLLQYNRLYISFLLRYGWGGWCLWAYTSGIVPWPWSLWCTAGCHRHATEWSTGPALTVWLNIDKHGVLFLS